MYLVRRTLVVYALEPLHVGAAHGRGDVDLPVARDVATDDPILTFSGVRGMLRDALTNDHERVVLLGDMPPRRSADRPGRGALGTTDAWPLLFPIRSSRGGFAWVTCSRFLRLFARAVDEEAPVSDGHGARVGPGSLLTCRAPGGGDLVMIAGRRYPTTRDGGTLEWLAGKLSSLVPSSASLARRVAIVPDRVCADLLREEMERRHRVRIEAATGAVAWGALFSLEVVPRDAIFFASLLASSPRVLGSATGGLEDAGDVIVRAKSRLEGAPRLTIGGEITVGMGRCLARVI